MSDLKITSKLPCQLLWMSVPLCPLLGRKGEGEHTNLTSKKAWERSYEAGCLLVFVRWANCSTTRSPSQNILAPTTKIRETGIFWRNGDTIWAAQMKVVMWQMCDLLGQHRSQTGSSLSSLQPNSSKPAFQLRGHVCFPPSLCQQTANGNGSPCDVQTRDAAKWNSGKLKPSSSETENILIKCPPKAHMLQAWSPA
jgi:hypothetical protein